VGLFGSLCSLFEAAAVISEYQSSGLTFIPHKHVLVLAAVACHIQQLMTMATPT